MHVKGRNRADEHRGSSTNVRRLVGEKHKTFVADGEATTFEVDNTVAVAYTALEFIYILYPVKNSKNHNKGKGRHRADEHRGSLTDVRRQDRVREEARDLCRCDTRARKHGGGVRVQYTVPPQPTRISCYATKGARVRLT
ncbi:unnamed protein product [Macrosiphum euphorbiae]|uniref:Uncharacterized protein n=1 Tax=Macrosiphum euphorbiae TaxID=13131 RepID=A0AAV0VMH4_9HEMI|nr:unnamed protein product [Macrosiphum euphorbiae]